MKFLKKSIWLTFVVLILSTSPGFSQKTESNDSLNNELMNAAREIMMSANTCALITIDEDGNPRVRAMDPFLPENDFTVWFGTNPKTRKVSQIKNNPKVTLYYLDSDESGYVTIHGSAQIVNEESEKEKRWKEEWKAFYQNKADDYVLIKVSPEWMEVISYTRGFVSNTSTWEPPVVIFDSN